MRVGMYLLRWVLEIVFTTNPLAHSYANMLDQHLYKCVLQSLPPAQAHLDDTAAFVPSMGPASSVFVDYYAHLPL